MPCNQSPTEYNAFFSFDWGFELWGVGLGTREPFAQCDFTRIESSWFVCFVTAFVTVLAPRPSTMSASSAALKWILNSVFAFRN
jgi:hypothetical protein